MVLTENEIVRIYKEAADKKHQISILAQICDCEKADIIELLELNNIVVNQKPVFKPKGKGNYRWATDVPALKQLRNAGHSIRQCAAIFGVSYSTMKYVIKRYVTDAC